MDPFLENEIRKRRDDTMDSARRGRPIRRTANERSVRGRIADGAQAMSDALAALAQSLRNRDTA